MKSTVTSVELTEDPVSAINYQPISLSPPLSFPPCYSPIWSPPQAKKNICFLVLFQLKILDFPDVEPPPLLLSLFEQGGGTQHGLMGRTGTRPHQRPDLRELGMQVSTLSFGLERHCCMTTVV